MALKDTWLARLFRGKQEKQPLDEPVAAAPEAPSEQAPPPVDRHLHLPLEHAVYQIWSLRCDEVERIPSPALCLEAPGGGVLPPEETQKELSRLQMKVNSTANSRLLQLQARRKDGGEDNSPPDLDAQVVVFLSSSLLYAWLLVYPPAGKGAELDQTILRQALNEAGVSFGLDEQMLDSLPERPERYFHLFPIACGQQAENGIDGRLVDLFPRTQERNVTPDEHNCVDYTSLDFVRNVEEGGIICKIIPPTQGVPGRTVQDKEIPAKNGRAVTAPAGRNTQVSEDGTSLVASIAGHVEFSGRSFQVKPMLEISGNVDFSTGNIDFLGDVTIHGDIRAGFTVRAVGNIKVGGVVEACTVEAGGDLLVAGGVQGDNQAVIRAQRNIYAKYLENASVYAKDLIQSDCIINCNIYCDGEVEVRTGRMTVVGGCIRAAHVVSAGTIGSRLEGRTDVILGGQPCGDFDYDTLVQEIRDLERDMEKTERQPDSPQKLSRMSKMRMLLLVDRKKLELLEKERQMLTEQQEDQGVRRMECGAVYPGTVLTIGEVIYRFEQKTCQCRAVLREGEICLM